jgi:hypothetical protein
VRWDLPRYVQGGGEEAAGRLTRAARDFVDEQPAFAVSAGLLALSWLVAGYGYDITGADVSAAYDATMKAPGRQGDAATVKKRICEIVGAESGGTGFVTKILERELGL